VTVRGRVYFSSCFLRWTWYHSRRYRSNSRTRAMKPMDPSAAGKKRFPQTDYFFHSGFSEWRGWSPYDGDDRSAFRNFYNLGREFRIEAARERATEMVVFAFIVVTAAWPVIYMVITVVKLLSKGRPLQ